MTAEIWFLFSHLGFQISTSSESRGCHAEIFFCARRCERRRSMLSIFICRYIKQEEKRKSFSTTKIYLSEVRFFCLGGNILAWTSSESFFPWHLLPSSYLFIYFEKLLLILFFVRFFWLSTFFVGARTGRFFKTFYFLTRGSWINLSQSKECWTCGKQRFNESTFCRVSGWFLHQCGKFPSGANVTNVATSFLH